ncbi:hypothetical protein DAPPUDRAFT_264676 [Daphnia pulex]|uniref:Uncharacterized protein n=1 Tax=Daphnia pulex TaxID=6669 RepID=E9HS35_DAPPU|nr:hypothetical protein DAPPUDRAFT_264676 [Daphnia pulex]|eukprot:EFX65447.1 hypothetical protein DAPPUDRAFT_264676 [Daphnia pulex]
MPPIGSPDGQDRTAGSCYEHHNVSLSYKDASLGYPVQIAVVQMLLLKDQELLIVLTTATGDDSASSSKE